MIDLKTMFPHIRLRRGAHKEGSGSLCAMELTNFIAGYPHSDQAGPCTCPVIAAFVRGINDNMDDTDRQRLLPYFERILGSRGTAADERARAEYLVLQAVNVFAADAPERAGLLGHAHACRNADTPVWARAAARAAAARAAAWELAAADAAADSMLAALDGALAIGPQSNWAGTIPANLGEVFEPRVKEGVEE